MQTASAAATRSRLLTPTAIDIVVLLGSAWVVRAVAIAVWPASAHSADLNSWQEVAFQLRQGANPYATTEILKWPPFALVLVWSIVLARLIVPRSSGVYYSMITLAFAQIIFFTAFTWSDLTHGEDGIQGISRPTLPGLPPGYLGDSYHLYVFTAIVVFLCLCLMYWLTVSPFGTVLHAIRENKIRARFLGYDVNKYRVNAFVLSAMFPAVAGWLWTYYQQSINPDAGSVEYSGNVVMMSLLGGMQTFLGPILGASVYYELQNNVSQLTKYWEAWIGVVFVVFVLVGPRGIMGLFDDVRHYGFATAFRRYFSRRARVEVDMQEELPPVIEDTTAATKAPS